MNKEEVEQRLIEVEKELKYYKELTDSLSQQKTLAILTGETVIQSRKSFKKLLRLPLDILNIRRDFLAGKIKPKNNILINGMVEPMKFSKDSVLFMATNGVGLGHLTRCLAIARVMKEHMDARQIIFLTTSPALHLVRAEGFIPFYVPSREMFGKDISASQWEILLSSTFRDLFELYDIQTIIFDGAIPYQSLSSVLSEKSNVERIWIRRGSERRNTQKARDGYEELFDHIIIPTELNEECIDKDNRHHKVEPVVYLREDELISREDVRNKFNVSEHEKLVYIQLGAGKINDIKTMQELVIEKLLSYENIVLIIGQSPIGSELNYRHKCIRVIKDYPNSKYFKGFDFAVSACGYNSFHEIIASNVPALFIPNLNTTTDDQMARALRAEELGCGLVLKSMDEKELEQKLKILIEDDKRNKLSVAAQHVNYFKGAIQAAESILRLKG